MAFLIHFVECEHVQVDLVTMLEKAIGYVKFLQLQVKVNFQHHNLYN